VAPFAAVIDVEAERLQQLADEITVHVVVVDDKDGLARAVIAPHAMLERRRIGGRATSASMSLTWNLLPLPISLRHCDFAAHGFGQHLGDGQAEPGAGLVADGPVLGALETVGKMRLRSCGWMPMPVSSTSKRRPGCGSRPAW